MDEEPVKRNADAPERGPSGASSGDGPLTSPGARPADGALLRAAQRGDREAFRRFADRHARRIYNTAWRLTDDRHLAEDISQEVLVRALRRESDEQDNLAAWLYVVTRNLAMNACRSRRRSRVVGAVNDALASTTRGDPAAPVARQELSEAVRGAIANLPEPQRAALVLAKYEGLCVDEIAAILGCTRDAVKMRVSRAMQQLRRALAEHQANGDTTS